MTGTKASISLAELDAAEPIDMVLAAARELRPRVAEAASVIERERQLPPDLVAELREAGLFHMTIPKSLGGRETNPVVANRVIEEIAAGDGSAGWCVMLAVQTGAESGFLPEEYAREIWGSGGICAGVARPIGRAVRTTDPEEGFIVSGRWPFASGSSHADWFGAESTIYNNDDDEPSLDAAGNPRTRMLFVPRSAVTLHDTWDTTGLRGTASNDFSVEGVFVPAGRGHQVLVDPPLHDWPLFRALPLAFVSHGSQALGVARGAIETAASVATSKGGWGGVSLREIPRIQTAIAEATALVESARSFLYGASDELWQAAQQGDYESDRAARLRARVRLATSHAATSSVRAVDIVHAAVGTTSIFRESPLERQFRDIHTAASHVMIGPLTYEAAGRFELGLEPGFPYF